MKDNVNDYFAIVKLVDQIFPSKSELNYTELTPEDLIKRLDDAVSKSGLKIDEEKLIAVKNEIRNNQKYLYNRKSNFVGNSPEETFDQKNYFIQKTVSEMRSGAIHALTSNGKSGSDYRINKGGTYNTDFFGNTELIESVVNRDTILNYVKDTLSVTCSRDESMRLLLNDSHVLGELFLHFGLSTSSYSQNKEEFEQIRTILNNLVDRSSRGEGKVNDGNSDTGYLPYFDKYVTDSSYYNAKVEQAALRITDIICSIALPALDKAKQREKEEEQRRQKEQQRKEEKAKRRAEAKNNQPKEVKANNQPKEVPDKASEPLPKKQSTTTSLEETIKKYQRLQTLITENIAYSKELDTIRQEIETLEKQLATLKSKKSSLEQKINNNENVIKRGI